MNTTLSTLSTGPLKRRTRVCPLLFAALCLGEGDNRVRGRNGGVVNADEELAGAQRGVRRAHEAPEKREVVPRVADREMAEEHCVGFKDGLGFTLEDQ
jgi:hypothetical protein